MKTLCRQTVIFLIPLFLIHIWTYTISPSLVFAGERITIYAPKTEEPEPKPEEKGGVSWLWIILGIAAVGGIAAAAGGGGGGKSSGGGGGSGGTIPVSW